MNRSIEAIWDGFKYAVRIGTLYGAVVILVAIFAALVIGPIIEALGHD